LACWLTGQQSRLELIQIPQPHPAPDAFNNEHYVGYYHLSFDVRDQEADLTRWLEQFHRRLMDSAEFKLDLNILLAPHQQMIGDRTYEVAFIADPDGLPVELLC
jgi:catechol 2,3-dioxygenase-like lactoylglutathione lyase family enzyme